MKADIAAIKERLANPIEVARLLGLRVESKQRGGVLCRCPVHNNKSGSLSLRVGRDGALQVKCHGCEVSGDILSLLEALEGSFKGALERAQNLGGIAAPMPLPEPEAPRMEADTYHALAGELLRAGRLDGRPWVRPVEEYLAGRGLLEEARREGWAALPGRLDFGVDELLAARLLRRCSGGRLARVWADHRLVIPWRSPEGRVEALQRRRIGEGDGPKYVLPWAPPWPYGVDRVQGRPVLIVEGAFDCLAARLLGRGRVDALGIPGTGGWRAEWAALARERPLVGLDRGKPGKDGIIPEDLRAARIALDCAGRAAEEPIADRCSLCGANEPWLCEGCGRRRAPEGMDWSDLWRAKRSRPNM